MSRNLKVYPELKNDIFASTVPKCKKERAVDMCRDGIDLSPAASATVECNGVIKPDIVFFGESLPKVRFAVFEDISFSRTSSNGTYRVKL